MLLPSLRRSIGYARHFSAAAAVDKAVSSGDVIIKNASSGGGGRDTLGRRLLSVVCLKISAVIAIQKWKDEGRFVRKYELNRIVRELRKFKRYKHALEFFVFCISEVTVFLFTLFIFLSVSLTRVWLQIEGK